MFDTHLSSSFADTFYSRDKRKDSRNAKGFAERITNDLSMDETFIRRVLSISYKNDC